MDSITPAAVPPPYKSRRGWLIAFGIVEILMACASVLVLLFAAITLLGPAADRMPPTTISPRVIFAFVVVQYGLLTAVFLTGGIGSIRCRNWARIFMLVVSALWLALGLLTMILMAFMFPVIMHQLPPTAPQQLEHIILVVMITVLIMLMVILPALFLFFYSRPSVKATCLAQVAGSTALPGEGALPHELPVPVAILGVWQAFGVFAIVTTLFMRVGLVFGVIIRGAPAFLVMAAISVLSGYAAWSIFRQRLMGWGIALFLSGFGAVNMLVSYLRRPDLLQLFREMMGTTEQAEGIYGQFPQFVTVIWLASIATITLSLVFILYTRKYFRT